MTALASTLVVDALRVTVEMRPPRDGEAGYCVRLDASPIEALAEVLADRQPIDVGEFGFGWVADGDHNDDDNTCVPGGIRLSRYVTITVQGADSVTLDNDALARACAAWYPTMAKYGGVCREAMREVIEAALSGDLDECADCGGSTAPGTPDPHVCVDVRLPPDLRRGHDDSIACRHRDLSCCPTCTTQYAPALVDVHGRHYWMPTQAERDAFARALKEKP